MKNDRQYDFNRNIEDTGKLMTASSSRNRWRIVIIVIAAVAVVVAFAVFGVLKNNDTKHTDTNKISEESETDSTGSSDDSTEYSEAIVGRWSFTDNPEAEMCFFKDGHFSSPTGGEYGTYSVDEDGVIIVNNERGLTSEAIGTIFEDNGTWYVRADSKEPGLVKTSSTEFIDLSGSKWENQNGTTYNFGGHTFTMTTDERNMKKSSEFEYFIFQDRMAYIEADIDKNKAEEIFGSSEGTFIILLWGDPESGKEEAQFGFYNGDKMSLADARYLDLDSEDDLMKNIENFKRK